jgi:MYXO-CTERM domain-containing protein
MYDNPDDFPQHPACVDYVSEPHPEGRFTMFDNVGHLAWTPSVDPIGGGFAASEWSGDEGCGIAANFREYAANLDPDGVYSWFASLDRPDVTAPDDLSVEHDAVTTPLTAMVVDDDTVTYTWTQVDGPAATLVDADQQTVEVSDLQPDTSYTFEVLVVDVDNQWDRDEVVVTVMPEPPPPATTTGMDTGDTTSADDNGTDPTGNPTSTSGPSTTGDPDSTSASNTSNGDTLTGPGTSGGPGSTDGSGGTDDGGSVGETVSEGCGCSTTDDGRWSALALLGLVALMRRRRTA